MKILITLAVARALPGVAALPVYDMANHEWGGTEVHTSSLLLTFLTLLVCSICLAHLVTFRFGLGHYLPEAGVVLLVGITFGGLLVVLGHSATSDLLLDFDAPLFFIALLPPIIFNGAYHLHRSFFFGNFWPVRLLCLMHFASALACRSLIPPRSRRLCSSLSSALLSRQCSSLLVCGARVQERQEEEAGEKEGRGRRRRQEDEEGRGGRGRTRTATATEGVYSKKTESHPRGEEKQIHKIMCLFVFYIR